MLKMAAPPQASGLPAGDRLDGFAERGEEAKITLGRAAGEAGPARQQALAPAHPVGAAVARPAMARHGAEKPAAGPTDPFGGGSGGVLHQGALGAALADSAMGVLPVGDAPIHEAAVAAADAFPDHDGFFEVGNAAPDGLLAAWLAVGLLGSEVWFVHLFEFLVSSF